MATLTSASTLSDAVSLYRNSLTYDTDGDATKAGNFIEACRFMLEAKPAQASHGANASLTIDLNRLQKQVDKAEAWLNSRSGGRFAGSVRYLGPSYDFRG